MNRDHPQDKTRFSEIDIHFANHMARLSGKGDPSVFYAAALASKSTSEGNVCLELSPLEGLALSKEGNGGTDFTCPRLPEWRKSLLASGVVGEPGQYMPLILDASSRLYLHRYWFYEESLARDILERASNDIKGVDVEILGRGLDRLFRGGSAGGTDWQKVAAFIALTKRISIISGGPGTGKTSVIAAIISLALDQSPAKDTRIALTAPTGKAAARMQEAVKEGARRLSVKDVIDRSISDGASTIHRLLGTIRKSPYFYHDSDNPLPFDMVIVDEVSMVDLPLLCKLVWAVPPEARLILMGDKDQLSSVAPGSILGDICSTGFVDRFSENFAEKYRDITGERIDAPCEPCPDPVIKDCIVHLKRSYRFGAESGIKSVSTAVNALDGKLALRTLKDGNFEDAGWRTLPPPKNLRKALGSGILKGYGPYLKAADPMEALSLFERFRILAVLRQGPYGVMELNRLAESVLAEKGLINPDKRWYPGRPLLITKNDYNLGLYNGDIGLIFDDPDSNNEPRAFFSDYSGSFRKLQPARLPEHETVFAMTVHKSQGSEFEEAFFILPDRAGPVLACEVLYTGLTRARKNVQVWGTESVFAEGAQKRTKRTSGLKDALYKDRGEDPKGSI